MSKELHVTGSRQEPRLDNVLEWSYPRHGELVIAKRACRFEEWEIRNDSVQEAVINTESIFWKKTQSLFIRTEKCRYHFSLFDFVDEDFDFPFQVHFTNVRSPLGKLVLVGQYFIAIYIGIILLNIVLHSIVPLLM